MNDKDNTDGEVAHKLFLATNLDDYNIPWGDDIEWQQRSQAVPPEANEAFCALALYWKYAWNNARSPHLTMKLAEVAAKKEGGNFAKTFWDEVIDTDEFQLSVLGSQVLAYTGFYFGYEHFLTECCAIRLKTDAAELMGYKRISDAVAGAFNTTIEADVWSCTTMEVARRARNALVHNGGLPDERLVELAPDLIVDGHISIHPVDVSSLFQLLKAKVDIVLGNWN